MRRVWIAVLVVVAVMTAVAGSQVSVVAQAPTAKPEAPPPQPLKVTVTISRFDAEKKTASLPFVLWVNTGGDSSSIRMGSEVPVPSTSVKDGVTTTSYSYRPLGTNIDCRATALADGQYRLVLSIEDSQVFRMAGSAQVQVEQGRSVFQNFRAQHQPILRDGQSVEFAVATDKTSGEVIRLTVALSVIK